MVQQRVLDSIDSDRLAVHVVWMPVLGGDHLAAAMKSRRLIPDSRVHHYWTPEPDLGLLYGDSLELPRHRELAWDVYFVFRKGILWEERVPLPTVWFHRLDSDDRHLGDGDGLRQSVQSLLAEEP